MDSYWIAYYLFPEKYLNVNYGSNSGKLKLWNDLCKSCGWWYPYENICFVSDRPETINKKGILLHCEDGPALKYVDGYSLWFLNGVDVGEEIVMTPADKLDPNLILTEKNADVRREISRKIGNERIISELNGKIVEEKTVSYYKDLGYIWFDRLLEKKPELITAVAYAFVYLSIDNERKRPFLKMLNPSLGVYHYEGVHPDCKTIEDAIFYRNGTICYPTNLS